MEIGLCLGEEVHHLKKSGFLVAGFTAIAIAAWTNMKIIYRLLSGGVFNLDVLLVAKLCLLASFYCLGVRAIRVGISPTNAQQTGVIFWRVFLGSALIMIDVKNYFDPGPTVLKTSGAAGNLGALVGTALIAWLALWLIRSGIQQNSKIITVNG